MSTTGLQLPASNEDDLARFPGVCVLTVGGLDAARPEQAVKLADKFEGEGFVVLNFAAYTHAPSIYWFAFQSQDEAERAMALAHGLIIESGQHIAAGLSGHASFSLRDEPPSSTTCRISPPRRPRPSSVPPRLALDPPQRPVAPLVDHAQFTHAYDTLTRQLADVRIESDTASHTVNHVTDEAIPSIMGLLAKLGERAARLERHDAMYWKHITALGDSIRDKIKPKLVELEGMLEKTGAPTAIDNDSLKKDLYESLKKDLYESIKEDLFESVKTEVLEQLKKEVLDSEDFKRAVEGVASQLAASQSRRSHTPPALDDDRAFKRSRQFHILHGSPERDESRQISGSINMRDLMTRIVEHDEPLSEAEVREAPAIFRASTTLAGDFRDGISDVAVASAVERVLGEQQGGVEAIHVAPDPRQRSRYQIDFQFFSVGSCERFYDSYASRFCTEVFIELGRRNVRAWPKE